MPAVHTSGAMHRQTSHPQDPQQHGFPLQILQMVQPREANLQGQIWQFAVPSCHRQAARISGFGIVGKGKDVHTLSHDACSVEGPETKVARIPSGKIDQERRAQLIQRPLQTPF